MRKEVVKKVGVYVAVFTAGACVGVVAGVYVAWACCLNVLATLLVLEVGVAGW